MDVVTHTRALEWSAPLVVAADGRDIRSNFYLWTLFRQQTSFSIGFAISHLPAARQAINGSGQTTNW